MGKFIAVGLTDILESSGLSGIRRLSVWRCFPLSYACLSPAVPQSGRFWPHFRTNVYATWLSPAFAQILFRIADSSVLPLAPVSPFVPLFLGFLQRYKPDAKLGTYYSLVLPYPLIFWWYGC